MAVPSVGRSFASQDLTVLEIYTRQPKTQSVLPVASAAFKREPGNEGQPEYRRD